MPLWNINNAPAFKAEGLGLPNEVVATPRGWVNSRTGELLVAIPGLDSLQTAVNIEQVFVTAPSKLAYKAGDVFGLTVVFTQNVVVTGTPQISVSVNGTTVAATYASGSGSNVLQFSYTVPNNISSIGGSVGVQSPLTLQGGTIKDSENAAIAAATAFNPPATSKIVIDGIAPTLTAVTLNKSTYKFADTISVLVTASEAVNVTGNPTIALIVGSNTRQAVFNSGSGSGSLVFTYEVQNTDTADAGTFSMANSIVTPTGSSIADEAGNAAVLSFTPPTTTSVVVSGVTPIISAAALDKSSYKIGDIMALTLTTNEATTVVGTPTIDLMIGNTERQAAYASGSGTTSLVFHYTVVNGDIAATGELGIASDITLPAGATMQDAAGNPATLTFTPPDTTAVSVNGETPAATNATLDKSAYVTGNTIDLTLTMNEAVTVTGSPTIALSINGSGQTATYASGSGTNSLLFTYTVGSGDHATAGQFTVTGTIALAGGATIKDSAGNSANLTFLPPTTSAVTVN